MKKKHSNEGIKIKGMFRINITEDGKLVGDSGWVQNQIQDRGFVDYIIKGLGAITSGGSSQIGGIALGTGTLVAQNISTMIGELSKRTTVTAATSSDSRTLRFSGSFLSSASFNTATSAAVQCIGLFPNTTRNSGTMFAHNTFATTTVNTNQNIAFTYDIIFG